MQTTPNERKLMWGITTLAFVLRLVHLWTVRQTPFFKHPIIDLEMYDRWASRIAAGSWIEEGPFFLDPLYPYLLALLYKLVGPNHLLVGVVQAALGAAIIPLLFRELRIATNRQTALLFAGMATLYLPAIYWTPILMKPALSAFFCAAALRYLAIGLRTERTRCWLLAGLFLSLAGFTRTSFLWVWPLVALLLATKLFDSEIRSRHARVRRAGLLLAGGMALLVLALAHNIAASGEWIVSTSNHGAIFYIGNHEGNHDGRFVQFEFMNARPEHERSDFHQEAQRRSGRELSYRGASHFWFGEGWRWASSHPGLALRAGWGKARTFWGIYQTPASLNYYVYREFAPVLRLPVPGFGIVGPLALIGLLFSLRRSGWLRLVASLTVAACLFACLFFVLTRFRVVILPAIWILASLGATEGWLFLRSAWQSEPAKRLQRFGIAVAVILAAWSFVNLPVRLPSESTLLRLADRVGLPTQPESTAKAYLNLGLTFATQAKDASDPEISTALLRQAETALLRATGGPDAVSGWVELGKVQARLDDNDAAIHSYSQALELAPQDYRNAHALGLLYRRVQQQGRALEHFEMALQIQPQSSASAFQAAQLYAEQGQLDAARTRLHHLLRLQPNHRKGQDLLRRVEQSMRTR